MNRYSTYRVAQHEHISSREHAWLKSWKAQDCTSLCPKKHLSSTCCVSFLAAPDTDTDHKHKFPLIHLIHLSDNITNTQKTFGTRSIFTLRRFTAEWQINTNPHLSQVISTNSSRPKRSSLNTSSQEKLSLTGI